MRAAGWRCLPEVGGLIEHQAGHCVWESSDGVLWRSSRRACCAAIRSACCGCPPRSSPTTADTTDEDLYRIADELAEDARSENTIIDDTVLNYVFNVRDKKRGEAESN